jgi:hypothetical protein
VGIQTNLCFNFEYLKLTRTINHKFTSFSESVIEEVLSCDSMADITGKAEYKEGGHDLTVHKRSL